MKYYAVLFVLNVVGSKQFTLLTVPVEASNEEEALEQALALETGSNLVHLGEEKYQDGVFIYELSSIMEISKDDFKVLSFY